MITFNLYRRESNLNVFDLHCGQGTVVVTLHYGTFSAELANGGNGAMRGRGGSGVEEGSGSEGGSGVEEGGDASGDGNEADTEDIENVDYPTDFFADRYYLPVEDFLRLVSNEKGIARLQKCGYDAQKVTFQLNNQAIGGPAFLAFSVNPEDGDYLLEVCHSVFPVYRVTANITKDHYFTLVDVLLKGDF